MYAQIKEVAYVGPSTNHPKRKLCNLPILLVQIYVGHWQHWAKHAITF
jgi:hypothetical protein